MTEAERILAARLLRLAADSFGNHGCNDMGEELLAGISLADREAMAEGFNGWNCPNGEPADFVKFGWIGDSSWMGYLADLLDPSASDSEEPTA